MRLHPVEATTLQPSEVSMAKILIDIEKLAEVIYDGDYSEQLDDSEE